MDQNCLRCRQLLSAAMDGEATQNELNFVRKHLTTCPECRETQAAFQSIRYRFQDLSQPFPPPQLRMAVMASISGHGRGVLTGRKRGFGIRPFLSFSQKMAIGGMAGVVLLLGSLLVLGIMRTPSFEVVDQQANLADEKVVLTFNQPVDRIYIMSHADLFEVKDQEGNLVAIPPENIKIQDDGKKVELTIPSGSIAPGATDVQLDVKPDLKSTDGKKLTNPGPKEAAVVAASKPNPTRTNPPRPAQATAKPTATRVAPTATQVPATATSLPTATVTPTPADETPVPVATATVTPTLKPTVRPVTPTPTRRPITTPSPTITPTVPGTPTVVPTATVTPPPSIAPTSTPVATVVVVTGTLAPVDTTPAPTTASPTTLAPTTLSPLVTPIPGTLAPLTTPTPSPAATTGLSDTCRVALRRGFEAFYNYRADVATRLGCPLTEEAQAGFSYQSFQRGFMLLHRQSGLVYIFYNASGSWAKMRDGGAPPSNPNAGTGCSLSPDASFVNLWAGQTAIRNALGCPVSPVSRTELASFQPFEKGVLLYNPAASNGRRVYVLLGDASYLDLPDTF